MKPLIFSQRSMSVFSSLLKTVAIFACTVFFFACQQFTESGDLESVAAEINKKCPVLIDEETQFDGVVADEKNLTYNFTLVNALASAMDTSGFRVAMWPGILSTIRVSKEMESLRNDRVVFKYFY